MTCKVPVRVRATRPSTPPGRTRVVPTLVRWTLAVPGAQSHIWGWALHRGQTCRSREGPGSQLAREAHLD